jgi:hypothetical protein
MKNSILPGLAICAVSLLPIDLAFAAPTRDVMQPGRGLDVAQEHCPKYAGDETKEIACVLFHAGAVKKTSGQYQLNIQMLQLTEPDTGPFVKCKAEMIYLPDGGIGWKETSDCH